MTDVLREVGWQVHRVIPESDVEWVYRDLMRVVRNAIVVFIDPAVRNLGMRQTSRLLRSVPHLSES